MFAVQRSASCRGLVRARSAVRYWVDIIIDRRRRPVSLALCLPTHRPRRDKRTPLTFSEWIVWFLLRKLWKNQNFSKYFFKIDVLSSRVSSLVGVGERRGAGCGLHGAGCSGWPRAFCLSRVQYNWLSAPNTLCKYLHGTNDARPNGAELWKALSLSTYRFNVESKT